jgi:hypothetical protein
MSGTYGNRYRYDGEVLSIPWNPHARYGPTRIRNSRRFFWTVFSKTNRDLERLPVLWCDIDHDLSNCPTFCKQAQSIHPLFQRQAMANHWVQVAVSIIAR